MPKDIEILLNEATKASKTLDRINVRQKMKLAKDLVDVLIPVYERFNRENTEILTNIAKACKVNDKSLRRYIQRREKSKLKENKSKNQRIKNETLLINTIKKKESNNKLHTCSLIIGEWRKITNKPEKWCGDAWYQRFMKRHADVFSKRKVKTIHPSRVRYSLVNQCKKFNSKLNPLGIEKIPPHLILNVDESRVDSKSFGTQQYYIVSKDNKNPVIVKDCEYVSMTVISFIAATGDGVMVVRILPKKSKKPHPIQLNRVQLCAPKGKSRTCAILNEYVVHYGSGWLTNDIWLKILDEFAIIMKQWTRNEKSFLFMDRLSIHTNELSLNKLDENNIEAVFLPPHSSHFMQPLDQTPFALLKRGIILESVRLMLAGSTTVKNRQILMASVTYGLRMGFTKKVILSSFRVTFLYPYIPKKVVSKAISIVNNTKFGAKLEENPIVKKVNTEIEKPKHNNQKIDNKLSHTQNSPHTKWQRKSNLFLGSEFLEFYKQEREEKRKKEVKRLKRKKEREEKRKQKQVEKEENKKKRLIEKENKKKRKLLHLQEERKVKRKNKCR